MIVDCPSCDQSYELHDDQVTGKSVILSCPPCNTSWIVGPIGQPVAQAYANADDDDGGETEKFRSAPVPQPVTAQRVRRGGAREHRDLFAERRSSVPPSARPQVQRADASDSLPPVTVQAAPSRPSAPPGASTGERSEHSLLFSVEQLKRAATMRPPPAIAPSAFVNGRHVQDSSPDAGIIDLKPMLSQGGAMKSRTEPLYTPVGEMSPVGGFAMSVPPPRSTPLAVLAGIGVAAVIVLGVALGFALHSSPSDESADVSAPLPRMTLAAMPPAPETSLSSLVNDASKKDPAPAQEAVSPMKASQGATAKSGAKGAAKWRWTPPARSTFTAKKNSAPPAPPAAKASGGKKGGSDPCGCGGNLQCAMKCGL
jgi:predicted Zn finger-like uncharacterized protein